MPKTSNFGHFDHFWHLAKSRFLSFLTILSPPEHNFWPLAKMCLFVPFVLKDLGGPLRDPKFDHILTILDPFWGSWRRLRLGHVQAAFGLEDLFEASQTHAQNLKFWLFWPLFLLKKSIFVILPIRGQWKCHFDLILTPNWAQTWTFDRLASKYAKTYPLPCWPWQRSNLPDRRRGPKTGPTRVRRG